MKTVTKQEFARLLGITTRSIEYLVKEDKIKTIQSRPMKFSFDDVAEYINRELKGKTKEKIVKDAELAKLDGEARIKQAKAEIEELKLKELRGELHAAEDIEAVMNDIILYIRSMLLAMPGKLAMDLANVDSPSEISNLLRKEIYYILNCAADYQYDPEEFARRVREREGWKEMHEDEEM